MRGAEPRQPITSPAWTGVENATASGATISSSTENRGHALRKIRCSTMNSVQVIANATRKNRLSVVAL
jgi:hypothetical protein